jgi:hypothetical protein
MKEKRFTEEQIIGILREQEAGAGRINRRDSTRRWMKIQGHVTGHHT